MDDKGWTPLHIAARHGQEDIVEFIVHNSNEQHIASCHMLYDIIEQCTPKLRLMDLCLVGYKYDGIKVTYFLL